MSALEPRMLPVASFGRLLKDRRRMLDLTQESLARQVGCAVVTIKKIEADTLRPSRQIAELLAEALQIPIDERAGFVRLARATPRGDSPVSPPQASASSTVDGDPIDDMSGRVVKGYTL